MAERYWHPPLPPLSSYRAIGLRNRIDIERKICRRAIRELRKAGYTLRIHSGDDWETTTAAPENKLMRAMFNLDEAWLIAFKDGRQCGWVRLVFGNDGWDVISDYSMNLEEALKPVNDYADGLS